MIYDTVSRKTIFSEIKEAEGATIRFITGDKKGNIWFSTQRGHIIRYDGKNFSTVQLFGTIIPKILIDNNGWLWLETMNQGSTAMQWPPTPGPGCRMLTRLTVPGYIGAVPS